MFKYNTLFMLHYKYENLQKYFTTLTCIQILFMFANNRILFNVDEYKFRKT